MKNNRKIIIGIVFCLIVCFIGIFITIGDKSYKRFKDKAESNIEYAIPNSYCSCINFKKDGTFFEYDCDSEVTQMPFTGEYYNQYHYSKKTKQLVFTGKNQIPIKAKVLEWNEDRLKIQVLNGRNNKKCAVDGNNTYLYLVQYKEMTGKEIKEKYQDSKQNLSYVNKNTTWQTEKEKDCNWCEEHSIEEIINVLEDTKKYELEYSYKNIDGELENITIRNKTN